MNIINKVWILWIQIIKKLELIILIVDKFALYDKVTRWLTHLECDFREEKNEDFIFQVKLDGFNEIIIFEPKNQKGVLVIGTKIKYPSKINHNYKINYNNEEKYILILITKEHADNIFAVFRFHDELDSIKAGVYVVMDKSEQHNLKIFEQSIKEVSEMGEEMNKFLIELEGKKGPGKLKSSMSNYFTRSNGPGFLTFLNNKMWEACRKK
jgi:hypothetical protein